MTPEQFRAWRQRMGFSREQAGEMLGLSASSVKTYELGHRSGGRPAEIPKLVRLACGAVEHGFLDYAPT